MDELAPRDVVARAVFSELKKGPVYLDARRIKGFDKLFPGIYEFLERDGLDPGRDLIPVVPVAHYSIGGIAVDAFYKTGVKRLYAVGEAADTGFHGANRLASNSSLECIYSGLEVARSVARDLELVGRQAIRVEEVGGSLYLRSDQLETLREIMWSNVGLVRSAGGLKKALNALNSIEVPRQVRELAKAVIVCALERRESRGVHFRSDYPNQDQRYARRSFYQGGRCRI